LEPQIEVGCQALFTEDQSQALVVLMHSQAARPGARSDCSQCRATRTSLPPQDSRLACGEEVVDHQSETANASRLSAWSCMRTRPRRWHREILDSLPEVTDLVEVPDHGEVQAR
jgi:hypothetical protein